MFLYDFGGVKVRSPVGIDGLRPCPPSADPRWDIAFSIGPVPMAAQAAQIYAWPGRYGMVLSMLGVDWKFSSAFGDSFILSADGTRLHFVSDAATMPTSASDLLVRRILPRAAILFGATAVHASAVAHADGGFLLMGASGAGKSTLAATMAAQPGWQLFGDDISNLWPGPPVELAPGSSSACVWPDSQAALALDGAQWRSMAGYDSKMWTQIGEAAGRRPLTEMLFLARSAQTPSIRLERLTRAAAIESLLPQIVRFNPHGDSGAERVASLQLLMAALDGARAWRLHFPSDYSALDDVVATLNRLRDPAAVPPQLT